MVQIAAHDAFGVLTKLTGELTRGLELERTCQLVADAALALIPAEQASVRLLDETRRHLLCGARSGAGEDLPALSFEPGAGVMGWVLARGEPTRIEDTRVDSEPRPAHDQGREVRSLIAAPLWSGGDVVGCLYVSSTRPGALTAEHEVIATLLANAAAPPMVKARLRRLSLVDDHTKAFTRRYLGPYLAEQLEIAGASSKPLSLLHIDLDHLEDVNQTFGAATGDLVVAVVADRIRAVVRETETIVRVGSDEFLLVMPAAASENAAAVAERIRSVLAIEPIAVDDDGVVCQTVSIGVATWDGLEDAAALERRADVAMGEAKQAGRNRVVVHTRG